VEAGRYTGAYVMETLNDISDGRIENILER